MCTKKSSVNDEFDKIVRKTGIKAVRHDKNVQDQVSEIQMLMRHCVRQTNMIEFIRCENSECTHCASRWVHCTKLMKALKSFGGRMPTPVNCLETPGHYKTLLRYMDDADRGKFHSVQLDEGLPSGKTFSMQF